MGLENRWNYNGLHLDLLIFFVRGRNLTFVVSHRFINTLSCTVIYGSPSVAALCGVMRQSLGTSVGQKDNKDKEAGSILSECQALNVYVTQHRINQ